MVCEHLAVTAITEYRAAEMPDVGWGSHPTGRFGIEGTKFLQTPVFLLGQHLNAHILGHGDRAVLWLVLLSGIQGGLIIAHASPACRTFGRTITEQVYVSALVVADDIWFPARSVHFIQRPQVLWLDGESRFDLGPWQVTMPWHIPVETVFQRLEQTTGLLVSEFAGFRHERPLVSLVVSRGFTTRVLAQRHRIKNREAELRRRVGADCWSWSRDAARCGRLTGSWPLVAGYWLLAAGPQALAGQCA